MNPPSIAEAQIKGFHDVQLIHTYAQLLVWLARKPRRASYHYESEKPLHEEVLKRGLLEKAQAEAESVINEMPVTLDEVERVASSQLLHWRCLGLPSRLMDEMKWLLHPSALKTLQNDAVGVWGYASSFDPGIQMDTSPNIDGIPLVQVLDMKVADPPVLYVRVEALGR